MQSTINNTESGARFMVDCSFLKDLAYDDKRELYDGTSNHRNRPFYSRSNRYNTEKLLKYAELATTPKDSFLGEINMMEVKSKRKNSVDELVEGLLSFDEVEKVVFAEKDKNIKIWLFSGETLSMKRRREVCYYFADKVDEIFDYEHILDFRIDPSGEEQQYIPAEAKILRRG